MTEELKSEEGLVLRTNATIVNELLISGRITEEEAEKLLYVIEKGINKIDFAN